MKLSKDHIWPAIGLATVGFSVWLLIRQLRGLSLGDVIDSLLAISPAGWMLAGLSTLLAYAALADYDRIALLHMRKRHISWRFIAATSFTAYALAHNIGASVLSGGLVRYRAYSSKGLSAPEVGMLVAFCSMTFALSSMLLGGIVLLLIPHEFQRLVEDFPTWLAVLIGLALLTVVALYVLGSWLRFKPMRLRGYILRYPRLRIVLRQLVVGPVEIIGAAAIIYFALPQEFNPGFVYVLGAFLASFSAALISHAPGGLGVLELVFLLALPDVPQADMIAALLVFRLFYLLIPFAISLGIVLLFEREQLRRAFTKRGGRDMQP